MSDLRLNIEKTQEWMDERLGISSLLEHAKEKAVPQHKHTFWYYWGGICLFLFLVQAVSGVLLLVYYRTGSDAYESVRHITYEVQFGWLVRSAHAWAANLMIGAVMIHMFSVFFMKAYRNPREFGWWTGLVLLGMCLVFGFSGYLLPADDLSFFATKVGLALPEVVPGVGKLITAVVRGGPDVCEATMQRFFALHAVVLPALFVPLLAVHLWLVQKHGNAVPPGQEASTATEPGIPFFPNFLLRDLGVWLIVLNLITLLAVFFPWQLGHQADPLAPAPAGIHPEWYFMSQFELLKLLGKWFPGMAGEVLGIGLFSVGMILWGLIPLYDSRNEAGCRARLASYFGIFVVIAVIGLTVLGYVLV